MGTTQGLISDLKGLLRTLYEEKEALLDSDGHKVADIVEIKNDYIEKLAKYKGLDIENNKKAMEIIEEINSLQEVNLLLTKQALSYQEVLLESISKNIKSASNTYSAKGNYESENKVSLIDQSV